MKRRLRWAALGLLLTAVGLGSLGVRSWRARDVQVGAPSRSLQARVLGRLHQLAPATPASAGGQAPASGAAAPGADDWAIPADGVEACGVRRVTADELRRWKADPALAEAQAQALDEQMQRVARAGVEQIAARLAAGNDAQQVAARLLMQDRDGAALLAGRSTDALAYQMALSACAWRGDGMPHCQRLNPRRWAELDPSDARPWLRLLADAQRRKDEAAVDTALAEIAVRPRLSRGSWLLEAQAVAVADALPDAAALGQALIQVVGTDAAMPGFDLGAAYRVCKEAASARPARLAQCRVLARQVLANTTNLDEAGLSQKLADLLGISPEQQAFNAVTLKAARDRFHQRAIEAIGIDCEAMRGLKQLSSERAASGELAMALALLNAR